jgi:hypothetical protein
MQYTIIWSEYKLKFEIYFNNVIVVNFNKFEKKFK